MGLIDLFKGSKTTAVKNDVTEPTFFEGISQPDRTSNRDSKKKDVSTADAFKKYNIDPEDVHYWYCNDPVFFGGINRVSDFVGSSGYEIRNDPTGEVRDFLDKFALSYFLRNCTINLMTYDALFVELRDDYPFVASSYGMSVKFDRYGNVVGFRQNVNGINKDYPVDSIVYSKMNAIDAGITGVSPIIPLNSYLKAKESVETFTSEYFNRNGTPRLQYIVKTRNLKLKNQIKERIKNMKPWEDLITGDDVEIKPISSPISDMMFEKWNNYLNRLEIIGLGIPEIVTGFSEGSNKANSRIQLQTFKYRIKSIQTLLANLVNTKILPNYFPDTKAYIVFKELDKEDSNLVAINRTKIAQALSNYVKNGILTTEEAKELAMEDLKNITSDADFTE